MNYDKELVNFYELPEDWRKEAMSNADNYEEITYIMPDEDKTPEKHILWDLSECMRTDGNSIFDGIIGVSNNSAIGINISDCGTMCKMTFI
ncbi:MAG: hypothetical protein GQ540_03440 [Lutibacter sp.]|uniref:hypothetical protein n=1 Tax=Lutibacter sp. TaxID=1925666 RepID=UPI0019EFE2FE|nr:hypothetical protein [Lutibacter sp.]NOR27566.1 hypothetical protein [Lutibacter sp.]